MLRAILAEVNSLYVVCEDTLLHIVILIEHRRYCLVPLIHRSSFSPVDTFQPRRRLPEFAT